MTFNREAYLFLEAAYGVPHSKRIFSGLIFVIYLNQSSCSLLVVRATEGGWPRGGGVKPSSLSISSLIFLPPSLFIIAAINGRSSRRRHRGRRLLFIGNWFVKRQLLFWNILVVPTDVLIMNVRDLLFLVIISWCLFSSGIAVIHHTDIHRLISLT